MIIDTHAHYDDEQYDIDRDALIKSFSENGIEYAINVGASKKGTDMAVELAHTYDNIFAAVGIHPEDVMTLPDDYEETLYAYAKDPKVVAIGEIGLDYHWEETPRDVQKEWFHRQITVARDVNLPVCVHSRDAAQDTFDIIRDEKLGEIGGVIHCYSYGPELAKEYLKMGFSFGIGGVVTFKNSKTIKEVVAMLPLEAIVLETDCPYLAPTPHRGERNSSLYLPLVADVIAEIKGISAQKVIEVTNQNARRLFPKLHE